MAEHNEIGKKGENIAFNYLKDNSYEILHQNHRIGRAEFDFICRNIKKELIFVALSESGRYSFLILKPVDEL